MLAIARQTLAGYFTTPFGTSLLAAALALSAWRFLLGIDRWNLIAPRLAGLEAAPGVTDLVLAPFLAFVGSLLLYLAPIASMRLIAEERRQGGFTLLAAAPIGSLTIVLGKFLGCMAFLLLLILLCAALALSLSLGTDLDLGKLAAGLLALFLLSAALSALGLAASSLAQHPAAAAAIAFALNMLLWMLDSGAREQGVQDGLINYLALPTHLNTLLSGIVSAVDVMYFLLLAFVALALCWLRIERLRENGA